MSDYGDDYSDYGEEWFFVEEEYMVADDLAEHAVQSPPPTTYDEDMLEEWDRYDYFNDLEYASDGYDNAKFKQHGKGQGAPNEGQKRKRGTAAARARKKQKVFRGGPDAEAVEAMLTNSPVVWRSQADRDAKPRLLPKNAESYALLKDWRKTMADAPHWTKTSHSASPVPESSDIAAVEAFFASQPLSPTSEPLAEEEDGEEEEVGIDAAALMAALQSRLAAAGGPLSGMDPQQLLQFAMRMANNEGAGDDIAGEMADEMLNQGDDEEEDEEAEANLLSWVTQQRDTSKNAADSSGTIPTQDSPDAPRRGKRLPTPPSSERNRSVYTQDKAMDDAEPASKNAAAFTKNGSIDTGQTSRKRKADDATESGSSTNAPKRRATRSYEAPTAASQARTAPAKTTRSGRVKR